MKKTFLIVFFVTALSVMSACRLIDDDPDSAEMVEASPRFLEEVDVCYQIFPIAFADSTGDNKGDIGGITENVDYLADTLGVDCVWLTPIHPSPSYHKYDVMDYYGIDATFGDLDDFDELLETMAEHDIAVVMDLVINHTSFHHPWFQRSREGDADYRDFYSWLSAEEYENLPGQLQNGWHEYREDYYYGSFWDQMPELNYDNPEVRERIFSIAEFWLERGVAGFRIDAARHIFDRNQFPHESRAQLTRKNIDFFKEFNAHVKSVDENAFVLGEVWTEDDGYLSGYYEGMDSLFNFRFAAEAKRAVLQSRHSNLAGTLISSRETFGDVRADFIDSIFLSNHDMDRIMSEFNEDAERSALAAHILFTLPGISWIYYGEEIGMTGEGPDPFRRQPFKWAKDSPYNTEGRIAPDHDAIAAWDEHNRALDGMKEQLADEDSLLHTYIDLIDLKQTHDVLRKGSLTEVDADDAEILAYLRETEDTRYLVFHNMSRAENTLTHDLTDYETVYASFAFEEADEWLLPPLSTVILEIDEGDFVLGG